MQIIILILLSILFSETNAPLKNDSTKITFTEIQSDPEKIHNQIRLFRCNVTTICVKQVVRSRFLKNQLKHLTI